VIGVIEGFVVVGAIIAIGFVLARFEILDEKAQDALSRLAFSVGLPALMFSTIATSHVSAVFSSAALVSFLSAIAVMVVYLIVAAIARWGVARSVVGALASGYVNSSNLGIPLSVYILGSASFVTPIMLYQLALITPIALTVLDMTARHPPEVTRLARLTMPLRNPVTMASAAGIMCSLTGWQPPDLVLEPIGMLAVMTVPMMLLAFGMSLRTRGEVSTGSDRSSIALASVLKAVVQPAIAYVLAAWVFQLDAPTVFAVVACAVLPTGQNVFIYAKRYEAAPAATRSVVLVTTAAAVPLLLAAAALLV
jgi:predicted permease